MFPVWTRVEEADTQGGRGRGGAGTPGGARGAGWGGPAPPPAGPGPLPAVLPVRGKPGSESSMYKCLLVEMACVGSARMASGERGGPEVGGRSLGQQRRLEGAVPRAVPRGQHFAGEVMQRVVGLCKATEPSPPAPPRGDGWVSAPLRRLCVPPVLPRYLSTSAGWRSALSSPGPARCTAYLGWGESITARRDAGRGGSRERPPRRGCAGPKGIVLVRSTGTEGFGRATGGSRCAQSRAWLHR